RCKRGPSLSQESDVEAEHLQIVSVGFHHWPREVQRDRRWAHRRDRNSQAHARGYPEVVERCTWFGGAEVAEYYPVQHVVGSNGKHVFGRIEPLKLATHLDAAGRYR